MANKVYVYKEYCDAYAYGEECIQVYADRDKARNFLLESVAKHYDYDEAKFGKLTISNLCDYLETEGIIGEEDSISDDYISIYNGNGVCYWIVEDIEVQ